MVLPRVRWIGHRGRKERFVPALSAVVVTLFALCCLIPFLYVLFVSFMSYAEYVADPLKVIPSKLDFAAYRRMFSYELLKGGYSMTLQVTFIGTLLSVLLLVISAYPLSKLRLKGVKFVMSMIVFTMFFNGGMIPSYLQVRNLGMLNTPWALILPGCISAYNLILMRSFISAFVPDTLEEAAKIDGANDLHILTLIVFPMIKPAIATMVVFCSVSYWNSYFQAMMYMSNRTKWPLMLVLREIVMQDTTAAQSQSIEMVNSALLAHPFTMKMAAIVITTLPIVIVYPFMQKYFIKGVALGAIKA